MRIVFELAGSTTMPVTQKRYATSWVIAFIVIWGREELELPVQLFIITNFSPELN